MLLRLFLHAFCIQLAQLAPVGEFPVDDGLHLTLYDSNKVEQFSVRLLSKLANWPSFEFPRVTAIDIRQVSYFTVSRSPDFKIKTPSSQRLHVFQEVADSESYYKFRVEVHKNVPLVDVFQAIFRRGKSSKSLIKAFAQGSSTLQPLFEALMLEKFRIAQMTLRRQDDTPRYALPASFLRKIVETTGVKDLDADEVAHLTDDFFFSQSVKALRKIDFSSVPNNGITDEGLLKLKAQTLRLGKTPGITRAGIDRFIKVKLDDFIDTGRQSFGQFGFELSLNKPSFHFLMSIFDYYGLADGTQVNWKEAKSHDSNVEIWTLKLGDDLVYLNYREDGSYPAEIENLHLSLW